MLDEEIALSGSLGHAGRDLLGTLKGLCSSDDAESMDDWLDTEEALDRGRLSPELA